MSFLSFVPKELAPVLAALKLLKTLVPPLRALLEGCAKGDLLETKREFYALENEAERIAVERARGG
jgi:hypothetical protein